MGYDPEGTIPSHAFVNSDCIEVRIPISSLSLSSNRMINARWVWGGGTRNDSLYSSDSDAVCILCHSQIINKLALCEPFDAFSVLNRALSQNTNTFSHKNHRDFLFLRNRTANTNTATESENQSESDSVPSLSPTVLGLGVIFSVLPRRDEYFSVDSAGYVSRSWTVSDAVRRGVGDGEVSEEAMAMCSVRIKAVWPLTQRKELMVDSQFIHSMQRPPNQCDHSNSNVPQSRAVSLPLSLSMRGSGSGSLRERLSLSL